MFLQICKSPNKNPFRAEHLFRLDAPVKRGKGCLFEKKNNGRTKKPVNHFSKYHSVNVDLLLWFPEKSLIQDAP